MTLDRRRFLQLSALGIAVAITDSACGASGDRSEVPVDQSELLGMLGPERVRQLGTRYRASKPSESSADSLRAALSNGHVLRVPFTKSGSLADQVRDDFATGRTVVVDGWVLSLTEARQAALFSLTPA